jgi:hypothetical protein
MKVYIVTAGCYSDYHIKRVFSNKEKAELYAKGTSEADIEEYELDDDKEVKLYTLINIDYCIERAPKYQFQFDICNSLDSEECTYYFNWSGGEGLRLNRIIPKINLTEEQKEHYKKKYKKVVYDLMAQIKYLKEHNGFTIQQINEWLNKGV